MHEHAYPKRPTRGDDYPGRRPLRRCVLAAMSLLLVAPALSACGADAAPVTVSREALGTVVTVTAYGTDRDAVDDAIEDAYAAMAEVEARTDAYDPASDIGRFNAAPYEPAIMPPAATAVLDAIVELDVAAEFSPSLYAVTRLYGFEGARTVPEPADIARALAASRTFGCIGDGAMAFTRPVTEDVRLQPGGDLAPGLDLGGAAKGLALDAARDALRESGAVSAAIVSSGSSTVMLGAKPDGTVWRIGVEDPRDTSTVLATFAFTGEGALSTSGDYQRYFEADGVRYHHILDPATGMPARGLRSLTVAGASLSGLHSDILSTALFVRGAEDAAAYARTAGIGLFLVDDEGRALVVPAPEGAGVSVSQDAEPVR